MAHKKAGGSTRNGRDSRPKYLGIKRYGGQVVQAGNYYPSAWRISSGMHVGCGKTTPYFTKSWSRCIRG